MNSSNADKDDLVYLKPNIALEPLIDQWYAWAHIVSPATAVLNIKERHLKIMKSYIDHPQIHEAAIKKPEMRGGPFIDYPREKVGEIKNLYTKTLNAQRNKLVFAEALVELNKMLNSEAKGFSLESLYEKVPPLLKGYVELVYDLNNRPSFRLFEALLYKSEYYDLSSQSIALQQVNSDDSRSFILSTPRLKGDNSIHLPIPFNHKGIDELYKMRSVPGSYLKIKNTLGIQQEDEKIFETFFTREKPGNYAEYTGDGIRTRYFGHACVLVETKKISILVDPVLSYGYDSDLSRYTYADLPAQIDYVLLTHNHQDHVLLETLLQIRHKTKNIIVPRSGSGDLQDPSLKLMLMNVGFSNIIELQEMEVIEFQGCSITGIPFLGEHGDLDVRSKLSYAVKSHNDFNILFVADSCTKEPLLYKHLHAIIGDIDVLFLGMECDGAPLSWVYGPLMPESLDRDKDQSRRLAGCNYEQAMELIAYLNPQDVFVYAMGMEPWLEFISSIKYTDASRPIIESNKLIQKCIELGKNAERLYGEKIIEYKRGSQQIKTDEIKELMA